MNVTRGPRPRGAEFDPLALHDAASRLAGQSGEELGSILRLANMGIWAADVAAGTFHCSAQVSDILEHDAGRISNIAVLAEYFPPNARVILAACIAQAVEGAEAWTIDLPLVTASGNSRWVRMLGAPSGAAPGERIVGAMQDITDSVAAREERDAATQRLALAVESAHIGLWDWNVTEDRFWTSPTWWSYLGFDTPQGAVCDDIADLVIHPDDVPRIRANRAAFFNEKKDQLVNELRHRDGAGRWRWVLSTGRVTRWSADGRAERVSGVYIDIDERKAAAESVDFAARHDVLTGLANRAEMMRRLQEATAAQSHFCVLMLDLDRFKAVNDRFGHSVGDAVLQMVATRIRSESAETDVIARLGGDEFAILHRSENPIVNGKAMAERLIHRVRQPYHVHGLALELGVSIGIAHAPDHGLDADTTLRHADAALYKVKSQGKNGLRVFDTALEIETRQRRTLEADLRQALSNGQFELRYHTVLDLSDRRTVGAEALLRWPHPELGLIDPERFLPIAEETALIIPITQWVIGQVCRNAMTWPPHMFAAINIALGLPGSMGLYGMVRDGLDASGLPPNRLMLEVTEGIFLNGNEAAISDLLALKKLGVRLAMDRFGIGQSSLTHLRQLPFDQIKIDRSFIRNFVKDRHSGAFVSAVAHLADKCGIDSVAVGNRNRSPGAIARRGWMPARPGISVRSASHLRADCRRLVFCGCLSGHLDVAEAPHDLAMVTLDPRDLRSTKDVAPQTGLARAKKGTAGACRLLDEAMRPFLLLQHGKIAEARGAGQPIGRRLLPQKADKAAEGLLGRRQHILVAHDVKSGVRTARPEMHMGRPGAEAFIDFLIATTGRGFGIGHDRDGLVDRTIEMAAEGDHHVPWITQNVDRSGSDSLGDGLHAFDHQKGVVGFDEDEAWVGIGDRLMHQRAHSLDVGDAVMRGGARIMRAESGGAALPRRQFHQAVDVMRLVSIADIIVQEGAQPGAAGFGIGGDPDDLAHGQCS